MSAFLLSAATDAVRWSHVTEHANGGHKHRSRAASAQARALAIVSRLRRATPTLAWSSFGVGALASLLHLVMPTAAWSAGCDASAGLATVAGGYTGGTVPWQVPALWWSTIALRFVACGMFGAAVAALTYSVRASTYWQLNVLQALDASVRARILSGRCACPWTALAACFGRRVRR